MSFTTNKMVSIPNHAATQNYNGKQFLVIHSTDNYAPTADAKANANYFLNNWQSVQAFTQWVIDDNAAYQVANNGFTAWGAGNINRYAYSQIEIVTFTDGARAKNAIANGVALAKQIIAEAKAKGITLQIVSHHEAQQQFGGSDHTDPDAYFAKYGYDMNWFRNQVSAQPAQPQPEAPKPTPQPSAPAPNPSATKPSTPQIAVDGYLGTETWKAVQTFLDKIGYKLTVDGINGPATTKALQQALNAKLKINLAMDGIMGQATIKALQRLFGTVQDGVISKPSPMVKAWQTAINSGKNWI